jgi:hypothetical protein
MIVMAHPKREARAVALAEQLGAGIVWDRGRGLWDTARRAWLEQDGEWHTVIQDDAIPSEAFRENMDRILEHCYPHPVSWYFGTGKPPTSTPTEPLTVRAEQQGCSWIESGGPWWAVAVSVHSSLVEEMVAHCDTSKLKADDARYTAHFRRLGLTCLYTWPSLVDHADLPSIAGPGQRGIRKAYKFGEAGKFDPEGPRLVALPPQKKATKAPPVQKARRPPQPKGETMRVRNRSTGRIILRRPGMVDPPWEALDAPETPISADPEPDTTQASNEPSEGVLACPECGKEYKTERGLDNHLETHA